MRRHPWKHQRRTPRCTFRHFHVAFAARAAHIYHTHTPTRARTLFLVHHSPSRRTLPIFSHTALLISRAPWQMHDTIFNLPVGHTNDTAYFASAHSYDVFVSRHSTRLNFSEMHLTFTERAFVHEHVTAAQSTRTERCSHIGHRFTDICVNTMHSRIWHLRAHITEVACSTQSRFLRTTSNLQTEICTKGMEGSFLVMLTRLCRICCS